LSPDPDHRSDEDLLAAFLSGEERAFEILMRRHEDRIFALAWRMMGDRADALDATQDAFVTVFRQAHTFRGESAFGTWLYRVGINACRDLARRKARQPIPEADVVEDPGPRESGLEERAAARIDVARALAQLPSEYREAVAMHDLGGIPYEEIARLTETNLGTVKSRISRGRARLAALLAGGSGAGEHPRRADASKDRR
jgi:RNA polymerase sigma-70 factor (ECF subfamily)